MIEITLDRRADGVTVARAEVGGRMFVAAASRGATLMLARVLRDAGVPDAPWQAAAPERLPYVLRGPSVVAWAAQPVA